MPHSFERQSDGRYRILNVEVFEPHAFPLPDGTFDSFDRARIVEMVERTKTRFPQGGKIIEGHKNRFRTEQPQVGSMRNLRVQPSGRVLADFDDLDPETFLKIARGLFRERSAEMEFDPITGAMTCFDGCALLGENRQFFPFPELTIDLSEAQMKRAREDAAAVTPMTGVLMFRSRYSTGPKADAQRQAATTFDEVAGLMSELRTMIDEAMAAASANEERIGQLTGLVEVFMQRQEAEAALEVAPGGEGEPPEPNVPPIAGAEVAQGEPPAGGEGEAGVEPGVEQRAGDVGEEKPPREFPPGEEGQRQATEMGEIEDGSRRSAHEDDEDEIVAQQRQDAPPIEDMDDADEQIESALANGEIDDDEAIERVVVARRQRGGSEDCMRREMQKHFKEGGKPFKQAVAISLKACGLSREQRIRPMPNDIDKRLAKMEHDGIRRDYRSQIESLRARGTVLTDEHADEILDIVCETAEDGRDKRFRTLTGGLTTADTTTGDAIRQHQRAVVQDTPIGKITGLSDKENEEVAEYLDDFPPEHRVRGIELAKEFVVTRKQRTRSARAGGHGRQNYTPIGLESAIRYIDANFD
jgi:hypothetical protein